MDKKKIGLILAYRGVNYGMLLQAFATQQFIEKQGYETEILEYTRTTNTADFKNSINPNNPVIQSEAIITAPPFFSYCNYMYLKIKSAWPL